MDTTTKFKQFKSDQAELILLRLELSNIHAEFWVDDEGFFSYKLPLPNSLDLPENLTEINWTRIDEVISLMAYHASIAFPESAFGLWYGQYDEYNDYFQSSVKHAPSLKHSGKENGSSRSIPHALLALLPISNTCLSSLAISEYLTESLPVFLCA